MNKLLLYIFFIILLNLQTLTASEFTMQMLRAQEKQSAISDFKKLYKERQSFQTQLFQRIKHKRSKSIDHTSVFQTSIPTNDTKQIDLIKPEYSSDIYNNSDMQTNSNNIIDMINDGIEVEMPHTSYIDNDEKTTTDNDTHMEPTTPTYNDDSYENDNSSDNSMDNSTDMPSNDMNEQNDNMDNDNGTAQSEPATNDNSDQTTQNDDTQVGNEDPPPTDESQDDFEAADGEPTDNSTNDDMGGDTDLPSNEQNIRSKNFSPWARKR